MMDAISLASDAQIRYAKAISAFVKRPVPNPPYRKEVHQFICDYEDEFKRERAKKKARVAKQKKYKKMFNNRDCKAPKIHRF